MIPNRLQTFSPVLNPASHFVDKNEKAKKQMRYMIEGYKEQCAMFGKLLSYLPKESEEHKTYLKKYEDCVNKQFFWFQKITKIDEDEILKELSTPTTSLTISSNLPMFNTSLSSPHVAPREDSPNKNTDSQNKIKLFSK